jgi:DNA-binding CsgD family transcriptional regulator
MSVAPPVRERVSYGESHVRRREPSRTEQAGRGLNCSTTVAYLDRKEVNGVQKDLAHRLQLFVSTYYCGRCDAYHLYTSPASINAFDYEVLKMLALGYNSNEIAEKLDPQQPRGSRGRSRKVRTAIQRAITRFYAMNQTHLVAIAITLGILDPREFVPTIKEPTHP